MRPQGCAIFGLMSIRTNMVEVYYDTYRDSMEFGLGHNGFFKVLIFENLIKPM